MTVSERRRAILIASCNRRFDRRENLANEFGVSKRTIDNDVLYLSLTYLVYTSSGRNGGIFVDENFNIDFNENKLNRKELTLLQKLLPTLNVQDYATLIGIIKKFT